ncbi:MAG: pyridoxamine 5'-phosphate oxidase family protein [Halobacteriota archaeon]
MEHVEYVYTEGIPETEVDRILKRETHGVLALADGGNAYAVPMNYHYDGEHLYIRVSEEPGSTKAEYADVTETAAFIVYDVREETDAYSVMVRGDIRRLSDAEQSTFSDADLNEWFPPFRLFDETIPDVEISIYELVPTEITGRKTAGGAAYDDA